MDNFECLILSLLKLQLKKGIKHLFFIALLAEILMLDIISCELLLTSWAFCNSSFLISLLNCEIDTRPHLDRGAAFESDELIILSLLLVFSQSLLTQYFAKDFSGVEILQYPMRVFLMRAIESVMVKPVFGQEIVNLMSKPPHMSDEVFFTLNTTESYTLVLYVWPLLNLLLSTNALSMASGT